MNVLKRWTALLLTLGLVLVAASCSSKGGTAANVSFENGSKTTITFMHQWPSDSAAGQNRIVNQIIHDYEKEHPNVRIKQDVLDNEQYKNKLKVLSATNRLPDVGVTWAAGFLEPYVEGHLFTPVDDLLSGDLKDKFIAGTTEAYAIEGKTYALPLEFNIAPVFYNKAIFEKFNLETPQTYDELKQIVRTLADNGVAPISLGNKDRWMGSLWYMYLADRYAGQDALADAINGTVSFMDEGLVKAASEVQSLVDSRAFVKGFNGLSNEEAKNQFLNGKAAMFLTGAWELPNFTTNENIPQQFRENVGFFKFPPIAGGKGTEDSWVGGPGVGLFIADNTTVKAEAKKFVEYFVAKWGEQSVTGAGVIPATKVDTSKLELPQLYIDLLHETNQASSITLFADVQMKANAAETHLNQIQALFGKATTPVKFSQAHDAAIKRGD